MLFFFQHHKEKSTFHDYYMEMITANFGDDLDHLRKVNDNFQLLFIFFIIIIIIIIAIINFEMQSRRISYCFHISVEISPSSALDLKPNWLLPQKNAILQAFGHFSEGSKPRCSLAFGT